MTDEWPDDWPIAAIRKIEEAEARLAEQEKREQETVNQLIDAKARLAFADRIVDAVERVHKEAEVSGFVTLTKSAALFLGVRQYRDRFCNTASAPAVDPATMPAWECVNCGQKNSGWAKKCGRCGDTLRLTSTDEIAAEPLGRLHGERISYDQTPIDQQTYTASTLEELQQLISKAKPGDTINVSAEATAEVFSQTEAKKV